MNPVILNLSKICFGYPGGPLVLDQLDFHLHAGDRIGLVAPNGSGKTTLFHIIMGLLKPLSGDVEAFGSIRQHEKDFVISGEQAHADLVKKLIVDLKKISSDSRSASAGAF